MLAKLEPFSEFQPTKPLSHKIEQFLRQYKITDFACNSFQDTFLLKAGLAEDVKPLGIEFVKPDFIRVGMVVESEKFDKIQEFFEFFQPFDHTTTLEHIENNTYSIRMNCTTCLEKVMPEFEKVFLERIQLDPDCLKTYQEESEREYIKYLETKINEEVKIPPSTLTSVKDKKDAFFSNANLRTSTPLVPDNDQVDSTNFQLS